MLRIAVDALGGDNAPDAIVSGSLAAARRLAIGLLLVGPSDVVQRALRRYQWADDVDVQIAHAPDRIEMAEAASAGLRRKPQASIRVATEAVRDGRAAAGCPFRGARG